MANVSKVGAAVASRAMWHKGGPNQGWMLNGAGEAVPRLIDVPIEDQFTKVDDKGFSIFEEKGFRPASEAVGAKCPPEVMEYLIERRNAEREMGPTIADKVEAEVERRLGLEKTKGKK